MINNIGKKKINLLSTYSNNNSQIYLSSNMTTQNNTKISIIKNLQKDLTLFDFIKQKNKFIIHKFFDEKNTKKFLDSKKKAMAIQIDDEDEKINDSNNNNETIIINGNISEEKENKSKIKIHKNKTTSPKKRRKDKKRHKVNFKIPDENKNINKNNKCDENFSNQKEKDSSIYNESDKKNLIKQDEEIKRGQTMKHKNKIHLCNNSILINNILNKTDKKTNPFIFSEKVKSLMADDEIEISSIHNDEINDDINEQKKRKINNKGTFYNSNQKERLKKQLFENQELIQKNKNTNLSI